MFKRYSVISFCFCLMGCSLGDLKMPSLTIRHQNEPFTERKITPSHPSEEVDSSHATVYIIRNDEHPPSFDYSIRVDNEVVAAMPSSEDFVQFPVNPGSHTIVCEEAAGSTIDRGEVRLDAKGGETYYYEARLIYALYFDAGDLELRSLSRERGAHLIERMRDKQ